MRTGVAPLALGPTGLCSEIGGDLWFPDDAGNWSPSIAKAVCHRCPVEDECLEYALENDERWGIWGGTSEGERRLLRTERRKAEVA